VNVLSGLLKKGNIEKPQNRHNDSGSDRAPDW
jgi:hypothetical protein